MSDLGFCCLTHLLLRYTQCVSGCISATYARASHPSVKKKKKKKDLPANAGEIRDLALIPRWGRCPGGIMATHSSILAWRIPWTEEPGGLHAIGSQRVRHKWSNLAHMHTTYASWPSIIQSLLSKGAWCRSPTFTNLRLTPTSPRGSRCTRTHLQHWVTRHGARKSPRVLIWWNYRWYI